MRDVLPDDPRPDARARTAASRARRPAYIAGRIPGATRRASRARTTSGSPLAGRSLDEVERFLRGGRGARARDACSRRCSSPTSSARPSAPPSSATARWRELLERHHALVRRELDRFRGKEIDTAGDGFFATFDGPARAIRCARAIVDAVRSLGLEIRAGVHTGECELLDGKIGGIAVTIGARVAARGRRREVLVSQTVKDLVAGSGRRVRGAGEHELKGVPGRRGGSTPWEGRLGLRSSRQLQVAPAMSPQTRYAKSGDVNIAYQVVGDGPARPGLRARAGSRTSS